VKVGSNTGKRGFKYVEKNIRKNGQGEEGRKRIRKKKKKEERNPELKNRKMAQGKKGRREPSYPSWLQEKKRKMPQKKPKGAKKAEIAVQLKEGREVSSRTQRNREKPLGRKMWWGERGVKVLNSRNKST